MKNLISILILCLFQSGQVSVAATKQVSVSEMEKKVRLVQKQADQLAVEISKLEKNLGAKHGQYLETIKAKQEAEVRLLAAQETLENEKMDAQSRAKKLREILNRLTLQGLDQDQNAAALAAKKILTEQVQGQLRDLNALLLLTQKRQDELTALKKRLSQYEHTESSLAELVKTMEETKKEKAEAYLLTMEEKSKEEEKLSRLRLQRRKTAKKVFGIETRFSSPLEEFLGVEYDKKGITYKFTGRRPVLAADNGEVVYAGRLSTYGNVVLIDHGNETRSVVLGQFEPKLTKGHKVQRGDVLGYTERVTNQGKIYFEVRKSDKVMETVGLMDQKFLKKHRITKI